MSQDQPLEKPQINRALRAFVLVSGIWGVWGQMIGTGTAMLNGFALTLGATASFFALMTSINSLMGFAQLLAPRIGWQVADHRRFILACRALAVCLRASILFIPLLVPPRFQLASLVALVGASLVCLQGSSPFYGSWQATLVPEHLRGRFTSRQTIVGTLTAMAAGLATGRYLDAFAEADKPRAFTYLFALSLVVGLGSVVALARAPFPPTRPQPRGRHLQQLLEPFRHPPFRRALFFYCALQCVLGLADPFYSLFMLDRLGLSYTTVSIYNMSAMAASVVGYRVWAYLVDRHGSRAVLPLVLAPKIAVPLLWAANTAQHHLLVPVAMVLDGFFSAGISVAITALLYGLLPADEQRPTFMGCWSAALNLSYSVATFGAGLLATWLAGPDRVLWGFPLGNLQLMFGLCALLQVGPLLLLRSIEARQHRGPAQILEAERQRWTRLLRRRRERR
ncbi:MAG: MFS transporter [Candidatus Latescibacteria bacterium]|nr:MFS transporter [Candidatus Latescibacterota bacterium]